MEIEGRREVETRLPTAFQRTQGHVVTALMLKPLAILVKIVVWKPLLAFTHQLKVL